MTAERRCGLVVGLVHSDLHDCHVTSQLNHVMSTTIEINRGPSGIRTFANSIIHC